MTVSSSQKLSEMRHYNFYIMKLREKWVPFYDVSMHNEQMSRLLCFVINFLTKILPVLELVYS